MDLHPPLIPDAGGTTVIYTRSSSGQWEPVAQVADVITQLTDYRTDLIALMLGGSWRTIFHDGTALGVAPDGKLLSLGGDRDNLYAAVRSSGTVYLELFDTTPPASKPATTTTSTAPSTRPAATYPNWRILAEIPATAVRPDPLVAVAIVDRRPVVASVLADNRVAMLKFDDGKWIDLGIVTPTETVTELKIFALGRRVGVWLSPGTTTGGAVYVEPFPSGLKIPLGDVNGEAYVASERIRLLYTDPKTQKDMEKSWDFSGHSFGEHLLDFPTGTGYPDVFTYGVGAIMLLAIAGIFRRRAQTRDSLIAAMQLPLASRTKRAVAGLVDLSPSLFMYAYMVARLKTTDPVILGTDRIFQRNEAIATFICIFHPMIAEMLTSRSLGKWLFGLRVANLDGAPAKPGQLFLRNLLRVVDFALLFLPMLMILITPLRQRIGDSAAGTIVVDDNKPKRLDETA